MTEIYYDKVDLTYCQLKECQDGAVVVLTADGEHPYRMFEADEFDGSEFHYVPTRAVNDPVGYLEDLEGVGIEWAIKQTEITESDE
jgi:hypothetical protein